MKKMSNKKVRKLKRITAVLFVICFVRSCFDVLIAKVMKFF